MRPSPSLSLPSQTSVVIAHVGQPGAPQQSGSAQSTSPSQSSSEPFAHFSALGAQPAFPDVPPLAGAHAPLQSGSSQSMRPSQSSSRPPLHTSAAGEPA